MEYIVKNRKGVYIKLDENGSPTTCSEKYKGTFSYLKARNILDSLPKQLKRQDFSVDAVPDVKTTQNERGKEHLEPVKRVESPTVENQKIQDPKIEKQKTDLTRIKEEITGISKADFEPTENILRWVDEFGKCEDVFMNARKRKYEITKELDQYNKELWDILHIIEIEKTLNLYKGWLLYKRLRDNRLNRRMLKDELLIIDNVINNIQNTYLFNRKTVQKAVDGLKNRQYTFRADGGLDESTKDNAIT